MRPNQLTGDTTVYLTKTQINKLKRYQESKKGMSLKLSKAQLEHNKMQGSGMFDWIIPLVKDTIVPVLAPVAKATAGFLAPAAKGAIGALLNPVAGAFGNIIGKKVQNKFDKKIVVKGKGLTQFGYKVTKRKPLPPIIHSRLPEPDVFAMPYTGSGLKGLAIPLSRKLV